MSDSENVTNETKKLGDSQQSETQQPKNRRAKRRSSPSELSERLAAQTRTRHEKVQQQIERLAQYQLEMLTREEMLTKRIEQLSDLVTQQEQRNVHLSKRIEQQNERMTLLLQDYARSLADVINRQAQMPSSQDMAELQQSLDAFETLFSEHMNSSSSG